MTEPEWDSCAGPSTMLRFLRGRASDRKLRLFACACCLHIRDFLPTDACARGVEVAERYADRRATNQERLTAQSAVIASAWEAGIKVFDDYEHESIEWGAVPGGWAVMACVELLRGKGFEPGLAASDAALEVGQDAGRWRGDGEPAGLASQEGYFAEQSAQTRILRDIFGNPFRPAPLDPAWLIPGVVELAQAIYDERAFGRLSVLADALEEAGCGDAAFLDHLRRPGPHVPGCWALDALLQKE